MKRLRIVTPVFNDWDSLRMLLQELDRVAALTPTQITVSAVNDGSSESPATLVHDLPSFIHLASIEIVNLKLNVGHQRAIAVGLCIAVSDDDSDGVLVIDADGEDPPQSIPSLLAQAGDLQLVSVVAQRMQRQESPVFQMSYRFYKAMFYLLTGRTISFGNFSLHSMEAAQRLTLLPDLWNNLAAAILRSKLPVLAVPIDRGRRYAGKSKMNYISLVVHGFSCISAYADTIFVRLLALSLFLIILTVVAFFTLLALRLFLPSMATPGWATTIIFGLAIITVQLVMTTLSSLLMLLNNRVQRLIRPQDEWPAYVATRQTIFTKSVIPNGMLE